MSDNDSNSDTGGSSNESNTLPARNRFRREKYKNTPYFRFSVITINNNFFKLSDSDNNSNIGGNNNEFNALPARNRLCRENYKNTLYFRLSVITANNKRFAKITNPPIFYNNKFKNTLFFKI